MVLKKKLTISILSLLLVVCSIFVLIAVSNAKDVSAASLSKRWVKSADYDTRMQVGTNDFSIAVMGDQQIAISGKNWQNYVEASYDYIATNKNAMNLQMFINLGDIFDVVDYKFDDTLVGTAPYNSNGDGATHGANRRNDGTDTNSNIYFWQQKEYNLRMRNKLLDADVPCAWVMGNHDYEDMAQAYRINKTFNETFPLSMYDSAEYFGGAKENSVENSYYYFTANGQKYMVLVLGIHPDVDIINWANSVLDANTDCKVIVATHAYFSKQAVLYEKSERLWNLCISKHDNVKMVLCGHSWTDGRIVKRVDYTDNGSPVYQFMINTQGEEMGGLGVFAQMIFRENGDIDIGYYAPAIVDSRYSAELNPSNTFGKYFMAENQFTINIDNTSLCTVNTQGEVLFGNEVSTSSVFDNFKKCSPDTTKWLQNVYAYNNLKVVNTIGLKVDDTSKPGYLIYHFIKPNGYVFKNMVPSVAGLLSNFANGDSSIYQLDISVDGSNWILACTFDDSNTGNLSRPKTLLRYMNNAEDLYVRVVLKADANSYLESLGFDLDYVKVIYEGYTFSYTRQYYNNSEITEAIYDEEFLKDMDTAYYNNYTLAAGDKTDHIEGYGEIYFRFDATEGNNFKTLTLDANIRTENFKDFVYTERVISAADRKAIDGIEQAVTMTSGTYSLKANDAYPLKVYVSIDNGNTFTLVSQVSNGPTMASYNIPQVNLSSYVNGKHSVQIKLAIFGVHGAGVGLNSLSINGTYDVAPSATLHLEGGEVREGLVTLLCKDGYSLEGWHLNSVSGEKVDLQDYIDKDVDLYAKWLKNIHITYFLYGGTNNADNLAFGIEGETITFKNPTKTDYIFGGWYIKNNSAYEKITSIVLGTSHIELIAVWLPQS